MLYFKFDFPLHIEDEGEVIIGTQTYPCRIRANSNVYIHYEDYHMPINTKLKDEFSYFREGSPILKKFNGEYTAYDLSPEFPTIDDLENFIKYINSAESEI